MKKLLTYSLVITTIVWSVGLIALPLGVEAVSAGSLIKRADSPAVFYLGADGKRYAFPRSEIYMTWYSDFSGVETVSTEVFNSYAYGGSVFPKAGAKLIQFVDGETPWNILDSKVYAVAGNGNLRHITSGEVAAEIFGANWETLIIPVIELLASEYTFGAEVTVAADFDRATEMNASSTINDNQNLGGAVSGGTSLTVALAADTPASGVAVSNAARVPFTKVNLTASADGDMVIDSWVVRRAGLGQNGAFASVDILDGTTMMPINNSGKTFNSDNLANFSEDLTIPAGTTKSVYLVGNMGALGGYAGYAGEAPALALESVQLKGSGAVIGSMPVTGNYQTLNGTIAIGGANVTIGAYSNAVNASLEVGKTAYNFLSFQIAATSVEDVTFSQVRVYQNGSASLSSDLANIKLYQDETELATGVVKNNYVDFTFSPVTLAKGQTKQFVVKADVIGGSMRTVQLGLYRQQDLLVKGLTYGYNATPRINDGTPVIAASDGAFAYSATSPVLVDNRATISQGTLRVGTSNTVAAGNITIGNDQVIGAFEFEAKGEKVEITALTLTLVSTTSGTIVEDAARARSVKLVDADGKTVAGPTDVTNDATTVAFTDTFSVPVGLNVYKVVATLSTTGGWTTNDTILAKINTPASVIIAKGETTGLTITPSPTSVIKTNTQTVKTAGLTVSKNSTPTDKTVIVNSTNVLIGSWNFDATNSGEDIRVTVIAPRASTTGKLNALTLKDGATALSPINDALSKSANTTSTFALSDPVIVTKGTAKTINLYANIGSDALTGEVDAWGLNGGGVTAYGVTTGNSATVTHTNHDGALITIGAATLTINQDSSSLSRRLIVAGTAAEALADLRLKAGNEDVDLTKLTVNIDDGGLSAATGSWVQLSKVTLKLDGTIVGNADGYNVSSARRQINLDRGALTIPTGDTGKKLSILGDIVKIGTGEPGTDNADIKVGLGGANGTTAIGASNSSPTITWTNATGSEVIIHKAVPQVVIENPGGTLAATSVLHRTRITAVGGDIGLWRLAYVVSTSSGEVRVTNAYTKLTSCNGCGGVANGSQLATTAAAGTYLIDSYNYFNMQIASTQPHGKNYLQIAKDATAVIDLYASVSLTTGSDSVAVSLLGDTASSTLPAAGNVAAGFNVHEQGNFVWSSLYSTDSQASALTTSQWFNGYLVSGLGVVTTTPVVVGE